MGLSAMGHGYIYKFIYIQYTLYIGIFEKNNIFDIRICLIEEYSYLAEVVYQCKVIMSEQPSLNRNASQ